MAYMDPSVQAPKASFKDIDVVYDKGLGQQSWSIATLTSDERKAVGIRWNDDTEASWFIVPEEIAEAVLKAAASLGRDQHTELAAGYAHMAADTEREAEAFAWSEALIGDALETR